MCAKMDHAQYHGVGWPAWQHRFRLELFRVLSSSILVKQVALNAWHLWHDENENVPHRDKHNWLIQAVEFFSTAEQRDAQ